MNALFTLLFIVLVVAGIYQILREGKQKARTKEFLSLMDTQQQNKVTTLEGKLLKYNFGVQLIDSTNEFIHYLKGNDRTSGIRHAIIMIVMLLITFYLNATALHFNSWVVLPIVACITAYFIYVAAKKKDRLDFETTFAEALGIIGSAVSVGNTVLSGIEQCGEKLEGTRVGDVFKRMHQRLEIGKDIESVLLDTYETLNYREYYFFVVAVIINMKGGGQLKEIMTRLGQIISNARIMDKKKYAKTSEARMSVKILAFMPVVMFFMLKFISPENFEVLTNSSAGTSIMIYVVTSTLLGLAITWSMMNKV